jgi:hypothetical protein
MFLKSPKFWLRVARWVFWTGLILGTSGVLGVIGIASAFSGTFSVPESSLNALIGLLIPLSFAAVAIVGMGWWFLVLMIASTFSGLLVGILDTTTKARKVWYIIGSAVCALITILTIVMLISINAVPAITF